MTPSIALVLAVLVLVIILFVTDAVRVDVVGLLMMVLLPLLGLVTPQQAIGGLGSSAVVSIIGVIILGAGMEKTGAMRALSRVILKYAGKSEQRVVILIASSVATISAFMQNIGAAALFLPAARRISRQTGIPCSRILLPMAYCAIIGGCLTMVGSSPLIMLNDIITLDGEKLAPFSMFSVTPIGLCLVGAALLYFGLLGKYILPPAAGQDQSGPLSGLLDKTYHDVGGLFEMRVPKYFTGAVPLSALGLRPSYYTSVVAICRNGTGKHIIGPVADDEIHPGDHIAVVGPRHFVETLACDLCWELLPELSTFAEVLAPDNAGIVEALVTPRSELVGKTIHDFGLRRNYHISPLALFRDDKLILENLQAQKFQAGDALLLHGAWTRFHQLQERPDLLVFTEPILGEVLRVDKAKYASIISLTVLLSILVLNVSLPIALLGGSLAMILARVISVDEAYQAVDWMSVFLLGGLIPLGLAFENTGAAKFLADHATMWLGAPSFPVLLVVIALLTSFFTLFTSNVGATVLMVPLAMNMAADAGADPRVAALAVALAASNTFILPTHQVNALVMRPGGFRAADYIRAGSGMSVIYLAVMIGGLILFAGG